MKGQYSLRWLVALVSLAAVCIAAETNFKLISGLRVVAIVLIPLWAKYYLLNKYDRRRAACAFAIVILFFSALIWLILGDWDNPHVKPIAILVGGPVALLTVPVVGFLYSAWLDEKPEFSIVTIAELLFIPIWLVFWTFVQLALNWIWI